MELLVVSLYFLQNNLIYFSNLNLEIMFFIPLWHS